MTKPESLLDARSLAPFASLKAFEAVFRTGGIRKAAEALNLNHAVVSRHIRLLEEWLGAPLVTRIGNRLVLTEAGARYHTRVSTALMDLALATREMRGEEHNNYVRLFCVPGFATQWLSDQLSDFERDHPEYSVELRPTDICANLLMHEAEVDVRYYGDEWAPSPGGKGLKYLELARPEVLIVANPNVAKRLKSIKSASALLNAPLLHEDNQNEWRTWLMKNGVEAPKTLPGPLCWHAHLAIAAAKQGRGLALANKYLVSKDLKNGELVELKVPGAKRIVLGSYAFVTREDRWSQPALSALRKFLRTRAKSLDGAPGAP